MGVRHNVEAIRAAGGAIERVVAVGGGTQGDLWLQIVSDVTGLTQEIPSITIGASYGAAFLAAGVKQPSDIRAWNPVRRTVVPRPELAAEYDELYDLYRELYPATAPVGHALAERQRQSAPCEQIA